MLPFLLLIVSLATLLFMFVVALRRKTLNHQSKNNLPELMELVSRYRFFQGKNLETFSQLLRTNNLSGIEQLIQEKFAAQGKPNSSIMASKLARKLGS